MRRHAALSTSVPAAIAILQKTAFFNTITAKQLFEFAALAVGCAPITAIRRIRRLPGRALVAVGRPGHWKMPWFWS